MIALLYGVYSSHFDPIISHKDTPVVSSVSYGVFSEYKVLFNPSMEEPPIEEQLYLFMKRFRTQPSEFFRLNRKLRLWLYNREMELIKKELRDMERTNNDFKK